MDLWTPTTQLLVYQICRKYFKYGYLHIHIFRSMHVAGFKYFIVFIIHEQGADNKIPV